MSDLKEASYKGNIGVMELVKFHSSAKPEQKKKFAELMKKKQEASSEETQKQMAGQIWDLVQQVTKIKLHQMESQMLKFGDLLKEGHEHDHILHSLAQRDINASIKDGHVVIYDKADHKKAQGVLKRLGVPHKIKVQTNEDLDEGVYDSSWKNIPLNQRSPKQQAAINAYGKKPKAATVTIHLKHEDGSISKSKFKKDAKATPEEMADNHLKHMQNIHAQFPKISGSRAASVHKVQTNEEALYEDIKIGDRVHVGLVQKDGAGKRGTVHRIDGEHVIVKADYPEGARNNYGTRLFRGQLKNTSKLDESIEEGHSVVWVDRNYKEHIKHFRHNKLDSPDVAEKKAREHAKKLEKDDSIRSVRVKPISEDTIKLPASPKPRSEKLNQLLMSKKNASGAHKDKKKALKQGDTKHKGRMDESTVSHADIKNWKDDHAYIYHPETKMVKTLGKLDTRFGQGERNQEVQDELKKNPGFKYSTGMSLKHGIK